MIKKLLVFLSSEYFRLILGSIGCILFFLAISKNDLKQAIIIVVIFGGKNIFFGE